jgi:phosphoglycerate dehydrogenase-like enzyme
MVGAAQLAVMPDHAILVNIARGSLVDADAVLDALQRGTLFGAGLDVMDPEPFPPEHGLWQEKRAVITSHSADTPEMTRPLLAARIRTNVEAFVLATPLVGVVDASAGY